jgi:hypothetical protein
MSAILTGSLKWIWDHLPLWIKWPMIFVMIPIASVTIVLWYSLFLPWQTREIKAHINVYSEQQNTQIIHLVEKQNLINGQMNDSMKRIEQHQAIMLETLLHNRRRTHGQ